MAIYQLDDEVPDIAASAWVAESAEVIGRVRLAEEVSIWFKAVLRGDTETLDIGRGSQWGEVRCLEPWLRALLISLRRQRLG